MTDRLEVGSEARHVNTHHLVYTRRTDKHLSGAFSSRCAHRQTHFSITYVYVDAVCTHGRPYPIFIFYITIYIYILNSVFLSVRGTAQVPPRRVNQNVRQATYTALRRFHLGSPVVFVNALVGMSKLRPTPTHHHLHAIPHKHVITQFAINCITIQFN